MDDLGSRTFRILMVCVVGGCIAGGLALAKGQPPVVAAIAAGATGLTLFVLIFILMWRP